MTDVAKQEILEIDGKEYSLEDIDLFVKKGSSDDIVLLSRCSVLKFLERNERTDRNNDKTVAWLSHNVYNNMATLQAHNCYWNDAFYIANRFGFDEFLKRRAGVVVVWNGRHKYFEWETHGGFDNAQLFVDLGIISPQRDGAQIFRKKLEAVYGDMYCFLPEKVEEGLIRLLDLTDNEINSAHLLNGSVWEKERDPKWSSGQYDHLPQRPLGY